MGPSEESHDHSLADRVVALRPLLYTVLRARASDQDEVDDMVQECLARLLAINDRLSSDTLAGYAVVMARNVAATHARKGESQRRHLADLVDLRAPLDPADEAVRDEDMAALRVALQRIDGEDREALVAHDVEAVSTAALASRTASTPAGVASRLNRTRGRLRVEYVLALERAKLPSPRCHQVLVAVSTADRRRQAALGASRHLAECSTCASLSPPLIDRRRGALLALPLALILAWVRRGGGWVRGHPVHAAAGTATAGAITAAAIVAASAGGGPVPPPPPAPVVSTAPTSSAPPVASARLSVDGIDVTTAPGALGATLSAHPGGVAQASGVTVEQLAGVVDATGQADDERFWIDAGAGRRLLVFLHIESEPPFSIAPGQRLRFVGRVRAVPPGAEGLGLPSASATEALGVGYYVEVSSLTSFGIE